MFSISMPDEPELFLMFSECVRQKKPKQTIDTEVKNSVLNK